MERCSTALAKPVRLLWVGRLDDLGRTGRLAHHSRGVHLDPGRGAREVGLDHEHRRGLAVQPETLHVVDGPDREAIHQFEGHRRQPGPGDARDRLAGRLERGEERDERGAWRRQRPEPQDRLGHDRQGPLRPDEAGESTSTPPRP